MKIFEIVSEVLSVIGNAVMSLISGFIYFILNYLGYFLIAGATTAFLTRNIHDVEIDRFLAAARGLGYTIF